MIEILTTLAMGFALTLAIVVTMGASAFIVYLAFSAVRNIEYERGIKRLEREIDRKNRRSA